MSPVVPVSSRSPFSTGVASVTRFVKHFLQHSTDPTPSFFFHRWKGILVSLVVLVVLVSAAQAFGTTADSQDVTLSATVRDSAGTIGTVAFTFELEEFPSTSAVMHNYLTLPPQPSAIPEPSTLVLVGLGVLGLMALRKRWDTRRSS